jgi:hypothetical protein
MLGAFRADMVTAYVQMNYGCVLISEGFGQHLKSIIGEFVLAEVNLAKRSILEQFCNHVQAAVTQTTIG